MRNRITIVASLLIVLAAGLAYGQSLQIVTKVNVQFSFMAGEKEMPGGEYTIQKVANDDVHLIMSDGRGHSVTLFIIAPLARTDSKRSAGAVFATVGGQKFLSEVWPSRGNGYSVHAQNGEKGQ